MRKCRKRWGYDGGEEGQGSRVTGGGEEGKNQEASQGKDGGYK